MKDPFFALKCWCGERHAAPSDPTIPETHDGLDLGHLYWRKMNVEHALALLENGHWPDPDWLRVTLLDLRDKTHNDIRDREWPEPATPGKGFTQTR